MDYVLLISKKKKKKKKLELKSEVDSHLRE
jgi:hypothetical protein